MNTTFANSMKIGITTYYYWTWYDCACYGVVSKICRGDDIDVMNVCLHNCYSSADDCLRDDMTRRTFEIVLKNMKGE